MRLMGKIFAAVTAVLDYCLSHQLRLFLPTCLMGGKKKRKGWLVTSVTGYSASVHQISSFVTSDGGAYIGKMQWSGAVHSPNWSPIREKIGGIHFFPLTIFRDITLVPILTRKCNGTSWRHPAAQHQKFTILINIKRQAIKHSKMI